LGTHATDPACAFAAPQVRTPIVDESTGMTGVIGRLAQMGEAEALAALDAAAAAWDRGQGPWPQRKLADRIAAVERFVVLLRAERAAIVEALTWEICKTSADAAKEFDRTMGFVAATVAAARTHATEGLGAWSSVGGGLRARVGRGPVGVNLLLAPFNYPLNEVRFSRGCAEAGALKRGLRAAGLYSARGGNYFARICAC